MDTLKKVLHPNQTPHKTDDNTDIANTQDPNPMRPNQQTREVLGSEPNVTGTDRPAPRGGEFAGQGQGQGQEHARISRGHHHPRQPVGATGLPPNHRPQEEMEAGRRAAAEDGNNFPGTNPHPGHSALGN